MSRNRVSGMRLAPRIVKSIIRWPGVRIVYLLLVFHSECWASPAEAASQSPNIVFILVDDLGWADVGCYGADLHETPNIDRLASQGIRFTQAYAASPVCTPTRASIMTGQSPARLHMTIWHEGALRAPNRRRPWIEAKAEHNLSLEHFTLAEALRDVGYQTWHVGKWHLGDAAHYPEAHGFDLNIGGTFWGAPSTFWYPYRGNWGRSPEIRYVPDLPFGKPGEYLPDRLTDEAIRLINKAGDAPFYLNMWYHTVHTPIEGKEQLVRHYTRKLKSGNHHQNPIYAAMVHSMDENVGRLLAALDKSGKADRTLVIFFSDNGGYVNDYKQQRVTNNHPLRSGKGSLYEGGIREPLIVRWPGVIQPGGVCHEPVISTDFYSTICEIVGVKDASQQAIDSLSLVKLLKQPSLRLKRDTLFWHYPHYYPTTTPVSAVRWGDWKLLSYYQENRTELFNLKNDLGESQDVSKDQPDKAQALKAALDHWLKKVDAQIPIRNTGT